MFMKMDQFARQQAEMVFNIRYWALQECMRLAVPHMPASEESSITFTSATVAEGVRLVGSGRLGREWGFEILWRGD